METPSDTKACASFVVSVVLGPALASRLSFSVSALVFSSVAPACKESSSLFSAAVFAAPLAALRLVKNSPVVASPVASRPA